MNVPKQKIVYFLVAWCISLSGTGTAERLYAIIVGDTEAKDIGKDTKDSIFMVHSALTGNVAEGNLRVALLDGKKVVRKEIFDAIRAIPERQRVFFYYCGHGFYKNEGLLAPKSVGLNFIKMGDIVASIRNRDPISIVTINDSCSRQPDGARVSAAPILPPIDVNTPLGDQLFFRGKSWVHVASSAPGESALAHQLMKFGDETKVATGSPFAFAFFAALQDTEATKTWQEAVTEMKAETARMFKESVPDGQLRLVSGVVKQETQTVILQVNGVRKER